MGLSSVKEYFLRVCLEKGRQEEERSEGGQRRWWAWRDQSFPPVLLVFHLRPDPLRASQLLIFFNKTSRWYVILRFWS